MKLSSLAAQDLLGSVLVLPDPHMQLHDLLLLAETQNPFVSATNYHQWFCFNCKV